MDGNRNPGSIPIFCVFHAVLWYPDLVPNLLSRLTKDEQAQLFEELNYMNLEEIRGFCSDRGIPYKIMARYPNGRLKITKDTDRKPIVLARVRHYLATGDVGQPT